MDGNVALESSAGKAAPPNARRITDRAKSPAKTDAPPLHPDASAEQALSVLLRYYGGAAVDNLRCVQHSDHPEGAHQARVALRRLRVALRMFKPIMRASANRRLRFLARDVGAILGELRDADVLIEDTIRPMSRESDEVARVLLPALYDWREQVRARVREALGAIDLKQELARETSAWLRRRTSQTPALTLAHAEAESAWRTAVARGPRIEALNATQRHELRKEIKTVRYAAEICAALMGPRGSISVIPALKRVQTVLGDLNDMAVFASFSPPLADERALRALRRLRDVALTRAGAAEESLADAAARWRWLAACPTSIVRGFPAIRTGSDSMQDLDAGLAKG
jgi:CHAD domain-containing protein